MLHRIALGLTVRLTLTTLLLVDRARRLRQQPDVGSETTEKILWVAVMIIVVSVIGGVFKNKLQAFANGLTLNLGWK